MGDGLCDLLVSAAAFLRLFNLFGGFETKFIVGAGTGPDDSMIAVPWKSLHNSPGVRLVCD